MKKHNVFPINNYLEFYMRNKKPEEFIQCINDYYLFFKALCYLQSEEIRVVVLQNEYIFAKSYYLHYNAGRANILYKYIIYTFFNFWRGFGDSFSILFPKASAYCGKKFLI